GSKLTSEKKITLGRYPGRDYAVKLADQAEMRGRVYLVGNRMYIVLVKGAKEFANSPDADHFLQSLKLKGEPGAGGAPNPGGGPPPAGGGSAGPAEPGGRPPVPGQGPAFPGKNAAVPRWWPPVPAESGRWAALPRRRTARSRPDDQRGGPGAGVPDQPSRRGQAIHRQDAHRPGTGASSQRQQEHSANTAE